MSETVFTDASCPGHAVTVALGERSATCQCGEMWAAGHPLSLGLSVGEHIGRVEGLREHGGREE